MSENNADQIIPNLWLGNYKVALDLNFLLTHNIQYIVNITSDIPCPYKHINYAHLPIRDSIVCTNRSMIHVIDQMVDFIHHGLIHCVGVLVHCKEGHHRSAAIVMAFLMKYGSLCYEHSREYVKLKRPTALKRKTCVLASVKDYYLSLIHSRPHGDVWS